MGYDFLVNIRETNYDFVHFNYWVEWFRSLNMSIMCSFHAMLFNWHSCPILFYKVLKYHWQQCTCFQTDVIQPHFVVILPVTHACMMNPAIYVILTYPSGYFRLNVEMASKFRRRFRHRYFDVEIFLGFSTLFRRRNFNAISTFNRKCPLIGLNIFT